MLPAVAAIAVLRGSDQATMVEGLFEPRAACSILIRWRDNESPSASVLGPLTVARRKSFAAPRLALQLFVRSGHARRVFGAPVAAFADELVPLAQVWGRRGAQLLEQLGDLDPPRAVALIAAELAARSGDVVPSVGEALRRLRGGERVRTVAAALGTSERQLRRLFATEVGVSPSRIARIARIDRVLRDERGDMSWAEYALQHGYCDQSHLIREFQDLLGTTPAQYQASQRDARMEIIEAGEVASSLASLA